MQKKIDWIKFKSILGRIRLKISLEIQFQGFNPVSLQPRAKLGLKAFKRNKNVFLSGKMIGQIQKLWIVFGKNYFKIHCFSLKGMKKLIFLENSLKSIFFSLQLIFCWEKKLKLSFVQENLNTFQEWNGLKAFPFKKRENFTLKTCFYAHTLSVTLISVVN